MPTYSTKKKLLITTGIFSPESGGPATYAKTLAEQLAADYQVTVLTYSPVWFSDSDRQLSYRVVRVWKKWPAVIRRLSYFFRVLGRAWGSQRILVLNVMDGGLSVLLTGKPFMVRISGDRVWEVAVRRGQTTLLIDDFQKSAKSFTVQWLFRLQSHICRRAERVIAHSRYLAKLAEGWGVPAQKIALIYSGVEFTPATVSREEARAKLGIAGNIIFSWGRLVPWKGFRMLVKIMPQLLALNPFFRLVIVGDGPERTVLETIVRNLHLERKVYLLGAKRREELPLYLAAADLFVYNTGYEGLSHQILEAMLAGVPVVTTNAGGNPELIKQGENGFMVKYNDEFNLVEAIRTLWQNPELREQFSQAGRETARQFTVEKMLQATRQLLN